MTETFGLKSLLMSPEGSAGFSDHEWLNSEKYFVNHGRLDRFGELTRIPELASPEALLGVRRVQAVAWGPGGKGIEDLNPTSDQLLPLYRAGYTIYFKNVERSVPSLQPLAERLARDLGISPSEVSCEAFASLSGSGAGMHFDPNMTFNIQLVGRKTWQFARNSFLKHPTIGWDVTNPVPSKMREYFSGDFPKSMPDDAQEFVAEPGSVVYVPHGMFHATKAIEPSFAILFTINSKPWIDRLLESLAARLRRSEVFREVPIGLLNAEFANQSMDHVRSLLKEFQAAAVALTAEDFIDTWSGGSAKHYRVAESVQVQVEPSSPNWKLRLAQGTNESTRDVDPETGKLMSWVAKVAADGRGFSGTEAIRALPEIQPGQIIRVLGAFSEAGILEAGFPKRKQKAA
jgi:50S ribosomal protein L16 3-hydroxylase